MKTKIVFTVICLLAPFVIIEFLGMLLEPLNLDRPFYYFGGFFICFGLYIVARLYPHKRYDSEGRLQGMHKVALACGSFFIYGDLVRRLGDNDMFNPPIEWPDLIGIVVPVLSAVLIYRVMHKSMSRKKKEIEQGAASDR